MTGIPEDFSHRIDGFFPGQEILYLILGSLRCLVLDHLKWGEAQVEKL
jgi:hypothetical protein